MTDKITKLIVSREPELINSRFLVKASVMDNGVHPKSIMFVVQDLVDSGFTLKFFKDTDAAGAFLKLLKAAAN